MSFLCALLFLVIQDSDPKLPVAESTSFEEAWQAKGGLEFYLTPKKGLTDQAFKKDLVAAVVGRLASAGYKKVKLFFVARYEGRLLLVRVAGGDRAKLEEFQDLFRYGGVVQERAVADQKIHESWDGTKENVPSGWVAMKNDKKEPAEYGHLSGDQILVAKKPVLTNADVTGAKGIPSGAGSNWVLELQLTKEGGERFDRLAKELFAQEPKGMVAILVDGVIVSKPRVMVESFGGRAWITGAFKKGEASGLARSILTPLPGVAEFHPGPEYGPGGKKR
ncbi:MAG: hypothetical protein QF645_08425 [Planctomycetota bacterium]|nr:hypothetical protein [Planctomycetota bacterium]